MYSGIGHVLTIYKSLGFWISFLAGLKLTFCRTQDTETLYTYIGLIKVEQLACLFNMLKSCITNFFAKRPIACSITPSIARSELFDATVIRLCAAKCLRQELLAADTDLGSVYTFLVTPCNLGL